MPARLLVIAVTLVAHYSRAATFGLYEDDYGRMMYIWRANWQAFVDMLAVIFKTQGQGRPFHDALVHVFAWVASNWSEPLLASYLIAAVITVSVNLLFFGLCRRMGLGAAPALGAAIVFALWPPDSTHAYLTHVFGIQPACLLVLTALWLYLAGYTKAAWLPAAACLVTYEPFFLPFLAAPLLNGGSRKTIVRHAAVGVLLVAAVGAMRFLSGEQRVASTGLGALSSLLLNNVVLGPYWAIAGMWVKPVEAVRLLGGMAPEFRIGLAAGVALSALTAWLLLLHRCEDDTPAGGGRLSPWPLAVAGLVMLILAYPLMLTVQAEYISLFGRSSRVHAVGRIGAALLVASVLLRRRVAAACVFGVWMVIAFCGALRVQQDYALAWRQQQQVWASLAAMPVPPITESTAYRISAKQLPYNREWVILPWPAAVILNDVFRFPPEWKQRPRLYVEWSGPNDIESIEPVYSAYLGPQTRHDFVDIRVEPDGRFTTNPPGQARLEVNRDSAVARALKLH